MTTPDPAGDPTPETVDAVDAVFEQVVRRSAAGYIEREVWALLGEVEGPAARIVREVVLGAARNMDNPRNAAMYKQGADVIKAFIGDRLVAKPEGGAGALAGIMEAFGARRSAGGRAAVDDAAQPE